MTTELRSADPRIAEQGSTRRFQGAAAGLSSSVAEQGSMRRTAAIFLVCALLVVSERVHAQIVAPAPPGQSPLGTRVVPPPTYYMVFGELNDGRYSDALRDFRREGRGGIKTTESFWIDSICFHTMAGECCYQMGQNAMAVDHYRSALELAIAFSDWLLRVQFEPLRTASVGQLRNAPWGQSKRGARLADIPDKMTIAQGSITAEEQLARGGVIQRPMFYPIGVTEIIRTTALAMRRWRELLGPACAQDSLTKEVERVFSRRPGPPNHYSEAWIDLEAGLAYSASGKDEQAKSHLERAVLLGGEYDHPLTAQALFELGRLALVSGDYAAAAEYFAETTYATFNYPDAILMEEAFRYGLLVHLMTNQQGMYPPLVPAANWARTKDLRHLYASLLTMAAENSLADGRVKDAVNFANEARSVVGRRDMMASRIGARLSYTTAAALLQDGNSKAGNDALNTALTLASKQSIKLFQIAKIDEFFADGSLTPRVAMDMYQTLLPEPNAADWRFDPLECLATLVTPHEASLENWFEAALLRKEYDRALEISDLARAHRFLTTLPLGGRQLAIRWMFNTPADRLDETRSLERQALLQRYPLVGQLADEVRPIQQRLAEAPLVAGAPDQKKLQNGNLEKLVQMSQAQELLLSAISLRREPCTMLFPPVRSTKSIQDGLEEGHAILSFFATSRHIYGFFVGRDRIQMWRVDSPAAMERRVGKFLRDLGLVDAIRPYSAEQLENEAWRQAAANLYQSIMQDSKVDLPANWVELAIVPDGALWYLPFEALEIPEAGATEPLISKLRVRYAPTVSLAIADARGRRQTGRTGVVLGKLFPRDTDQVADASFDEISRVVPGSVPLRGPLPASASLVAKLFDRLIVLDDIVPDAKAAYDWSPIQVDKASHDRTIYDWLDLPWPAPDQVVLPGFHTAAENGLKHAVMQPAGREIFLSLMAMMGSGTRTILMSRWRTGGKTSVDLAREFVQELPHTTSAEAWQRSVFMSLDSPLDPDREPRVEVSTKRDPPKASHPFFWSAYMLVDSGILPEARERPPAAQPPGAQRPVAPPAEGEPAPGEPGAPQPNRRDGVR